MNLRDYWCKILLLIKAGVKYTNDKYIIKKNNKIKLKIVKVKNM